MRGSKSKMWLISCILEIIFQLPTIFQIAIRGYLLAGLLTACYDFWQLIKSNDRKSKVISIKRSTSRLVKLLSESKKTKSKEREKRRKPKSHDTWATDEWTCRKLWHRQAADELTNWLTDWLTDDHSVKQTARQPAVNPPLRSLHQPPTTEHQAPPPTVFSLQFWDSSFQPRLRRNATQRIAIFKLLRGLVFWDIWHVNVAHTLSHTHTHTPGLYS